MEEITDEDFLQLMSMLEDYHGQSTSSFAPTEAASTQTIINSVSTTTFATNTQCGEGQNNTSTCTTIQPEVPIPFKGFPHNSRLSDEDKKGITDWLLAKQNNGKLPYGGVTNAVKIFNVSRTTMSIIWKKVKDQLQQGVRISVKNNRKGRCGRKPIIITYEQVAAVPLSKRHSLRSFATALNISVSVLHRLVKQKLILPNSNCLKPSLRDGNKIRRLEWILSWFTQQSICRNPTFQSMYEVIYIDEKHFWLEMMIQHIYLHPQEDQPHRECKNKRFIKKCMFMGAVARPRWHENGSCLFDGKIGIFPFVQWVLAQRSSVHRPAGTLELKAIDSVNRDVVKTMLIHTLLPAIKACWPQGAIRNIVIVQDNARPHIIYSDPDWRIVASQDGYNFRLAQQPPNSPNLNILDLGFFNSIQSLQQKTTTKTIPELVEAVQRSYNELHPKTLSNVWMSLQFVMCEVLKVNGGNNYKLPHANKQKREDEGTLSSEIQASVTDVQNARNTIRQWYLLEDDN